MQLEIHIGYVYGRKEPPAHASHYKPKFVVGARLPHGWIKLRGHSALPPTDVSYVKEFSGEDIQARRYSTLDLCPFDSFALLVGSRSRWASRFEALQTGLKDQGVRLCIFAAGEDFDFRDSSCAELFSNKTGLESGGGLLVRPDQHLLRVLKAEDGHEDISRTILEYLGAGTST